MWMVGTVEGEPLFPRRNLAWARARTIGARYAACLTGSDQSQCHGRGVRSERGLNARERSWLPVAPKYGGDICGPRSKMCRS